MKSDRDKQSDPRQSNSTLLSAKTLFGERREIAIEFKGEIYRLRITRNDKLILTK